MKSYIVLSVCLLAMTVTACAKSPPITRIVRVDCSEGLDLRRYEPGERPRVIDEGEDWRDYGERKCSPPPRRCTPA